MNTETLKLVVDMLGRIGTDAREAFIWFLVADIVKDFICPAACVTVFALIARAVVRCVRLSYDADKWDKERADFEKAHRSKCGMALTKLARHACITLEYSTTLELYDFQIEKVVKHYTALHDEKHPRPAVEKSEGKYPLTQSEALGTGFPTAHP